MNSLHRASVIGSKIIYSITMSKRLAVFISVIALLPVLGVGALVWHVLRPTSDKPQVLSQTTGSSDAGSSSLGVVSSSGVPLGGLDSVAGSGQNNASSNGNASSPQSTFGGSNSSAPSSSTSNSSNTSSGNAGTLDPTKFGQYDIYKDAKYTTALFGEVKPGTGDEVTAATSGKTLIVNYSGWLTNGQMFDQNISSTKPFSFVYGKGSVIPGWEQGIFGMKVGGERLLIVPPAVGYGATGQGPIPGNSVLIFDVKLIGIQ
jgi:hypothetical protein